MAETTRQESGPTAYQDKPGESPGASGREGSPELGAGQGATGAPASEPGATSDGNGEKSGRKIPVIWILAGALAILGLVYGLHAWWWGRTHVSTDDAYVTGDLVNVSPAIQGTLIELTVKEGDYVKKGQLIARLDPSGPLSALRQAQANYQAAVSMVPEAQRTLEYQQASTRASIDKANAALRAQRAKALGAQRQAELTGATTSNQVAQAKAQVSAASAQRDQMDAQVQTAMATRANYVQAVVTAQAGLANFRQQVQTAERAVEAAQARLQGAVAQADRAARDEARDLTLYQQDAISAQQYDQARAQARDLAAQVDADRATVAQSNSQLESARRAAEQAASQVGQARKTVNQGDAQVRAAQRAADAAAEQVRVARAGLGIAEANLGQVGIQQTNVESVASQTEESAADVSTAQAGQTQNQLRREQVLTAQAQAMQAKAALTNAKVTYDDCFIYAPTDGMVVRKDANAGQVLSTGSTIVTMTKGLHVWVDANYKETQLANVRPGQSAEIDVDAFGGKEYRGVVESVNEATGASTALLPPDNSTGNFTKVVQRIAVRIRFVPYDGDNAGDLKSLRQGMSVTAIIDTDTGPAAGQTSGAGSPAGAGEASEEGGSSSHSKPAPTSGVGASAVPSGSNDPTVGGQVSSGGGPPNDVNGTGVTGTGSSTAAGMSANPTLNNASGPNDDNGTAGSGTGSAPSPGMSASPAQNGTNGPNPTNGGQGASGTPGAKGGNGASGPGGANSTPGASGAPGSTVTPSSSGSTGNGGATSGGGGGNG